MTRLLVRWMRVVLPTSEFAWLAIFVEMVIELAYLGIFARGWQPDEEFFRNARLGWLGVCACAYGASRVALFHPAFNEQYRNWLESTPWTASRPLPGGPIHLVLQDLVVVAALMLLSRDATQQVLLLPLLFLTAYLTVLAISCRICGDWALAYLLGFGLGAVALSGGAALVGCLVAAALCPMALIAAQRSLRRFPWKVDWRPVIRMVKQNQEEASMDRLGWPHDFMAPKPPAVWFPYPDGICLSLLLGWYVFVAHWHAEGVGRAMICGGTFQVVPFAVLARIANYMRAHRWPISPAGRLWTLRWIIPSYDVIYVAPLLTVATLLATQLGAIALFFANGRQGNVANPMIDWLAMGLSSGGVAAAFMVLFVMGPVLERWRLAAAHRILFDATNRQSAAAFVEL